MAAELFEGAKTPVVEDWQRERAEQAHVQRAYRLALTEREKQPIRHVKMFTTALCDVRVDGHGGRVRVLSVQYGSGVFQKMFCGKRKEKLAVNNIDIIEHNSYSTI